VCRAGRRRGRWEGRACRRRRRAAPALRRRRCREDLLRRPIAAAGRALSRGARAPLHTSVGVQERGRIAPVDGLPKRPTETVEGTGRGGRVEHTPDLADRRRRGGRLRRSGAGSLARAAGREPDRGCRKQPPHSNCHALDARPAGPEPARSGCAAARLGSVSSQRRHRRDHPQGRPPPRASPPQSRVADLDRPGAGGLPDRRRDPMAAGLEGNIAAAPRRAGQPTWRRPGLPTTTLRMLDPATIESTPGPRPSERARGRAPLALP
jgi:hypothetical protein